MKTPLHHICTVCGKRTSLRSCRRCLDHCECPKRPYDGGDPHAPAGPPIRDDGQRWSNDPNEEPMTTTTANDEPDAIYVGRTTRGGHDYEPWHVTLFGLTWDYGSEEYVRKRASALRDRLNAALRDERHRAAADAEAALEMAEATLATGWPNTLTLVKVREALARIRSNG